MKTYKYLTATTVAVFEDDGISRMSCLTSVVPDGAVIEPADLPTIEEIVAQALVAIDSDTDTIYGAVLGNRGPEYLDAELAAQAYKDAGYTGTVPEDVQCYATPMGWTAQQAADDILITAANWRLAKSAIRAQRLAAKEAVRNAIDVAGVETALAEWAGFVAVIRGQLGI